MANFGPRVSRILSGAQKIVALTRIETVLLLRPTITSDGAGGSTTTWATVGVLSARIRPQGMRPWEREDRVEGRAIAQSVWTIDLPAGTDVRTTDRIQNGTVMYEVIAANRPRTFEIECSVYAVVIT